MVLTIYLAKEFRVCFVENQQTFWIENESIHVVEVKQTYIDSPGVSAWRSELKFFTEVKGVVEEE